MHTSVGLVGSLFLCLVTAAQSNAPITLRLSLADGRRSYKAGEPIYLALTFTAIEPGLSLNTTITEPASPVDTLVLSPMTGVVRWMDDQALGRRYYPDYASLVSLEVGKPETVTLPLNAVYRFDAPGYYSIHILTSRALRGGAMQSQPIGQLTSNLISFDVEPMDEKDEADRASKLEQQIRQAADLKQSQKYADELDWLTGDPSTKAKLSLFLHPKTFYPFSINVSRGLWIARNRALVVAELEQALRDPSQTFPMAFSLLQTAVALQARLESPFDPADPGRPLPSEQIEKVYLKEIAASLPQREGEALVTAAQTVFVQLAHSKETAGPEFAASREIMITHFSEVNEFSVDWLLNGFGQYLEDTRMVPALKQILANQQGRYLDGARTAARRQLMKIIPQGSRN